ncbi:hypothetical protein [Rhodoferax antarcticus]|nr:hypothetical protein [Rhodoferax antarcticus]MCW2314432.1 hypothetical protein [Rhodoferax antarcticus]
MPNWPVALVEYAQAATKTIAFQFDDKHRHGAQRYVVMVAGEP